MPHCHVVCPCASASVCSEAAGTYIARWYIISHNRTTHPSPAQLIRGPIERGGSKVGVSHSKTAHARRTTQAKREAAFEQRRQKALAAGGGQKNARTSTALQNVTNFAKPPPVADDKGTNTRTCDPDTRDTHTHARTRARTPREARTRGTRTHARHAREGAHTHTNARTGARTRARAHVHMHPHTRARIHRQGQEAHWLAQ